MRTPIIFCDDHLSSFSTTVMAMIDCFSAGILVADYLCDPIDRFPAAGELVLTEQLSLRIGGCAANTALDLARLGANVGIVGCVGDDPFGQFVIDTLSAQNIDTEHIRRIVQTSTSGTLIVNVQGEDRRFIHAIGANAALKASDISSELIRQAKVFYLGGYLLMPGLAADELADLFRTARTAGVKTVLDVVLPDDRNYWADLEPLLAETDVFLPNEDEAAALTGLQDPIQQAERFLQAGAQTAVITCGDSGTVLFSHDVRVKSGVYSVPFVGGTGAGDAFTAGDIAGMLRGEDPSGCLHWGSALGASCVRGVGATETVFGEEEAEAFIAGAELPIEEF